MIWEHTGNSANIDYYAKKPRKDGSLWCEVLRSELRMIDGTLRRINPVYYFGVYEQGIGELVRFEFQFWHDPGKGHVLSPRTVARLVNGRDQDVEVL